MKLVGSIYPSWDDMSPYVVHFTKTDPTRNAAHNSISIAASCMLEAENRHGIGKSYMASPKTVCLSEVPLHQLRRLAQRRSRYGIGFLKEFVVSKGGGPIMYAYNGTAHAAALREAVEENIDDPSHPIWTIAPFVDTPGEFPTTQYFFEWEREWRVVERLRFQPEDVAFLILPEDIHKSARDFFDDAEADNVGPNYKCPFIDPYWGIEKIKKALS